VKIKKLAASTLLPAAVAGLTLSSGAAAMAAPVRHFGAGAAGHRTSGGTHQRLAAHRGDTLGALAAASWEALYATSPSHRAAPRPDELTAAQRLGSQASRSATARYAVLARPAVLAREAVQAREETARQAREHAEPAPAAQSGPAVTAGDSAFEQCVAWRESGDTPTDPDGLFGILPYIWQSLGYSGTAGQAPVAVQQAAFSRLYAEYGTQPWAPSDGC
jgi:hypothetical protein